jgi:3-deoxy-D-manno-octulosonic-acid transferase
MIVPAGCAGVNARLYSRRAANDPAADAPDAPVPGGVTPARSPPMHVFYTLVALAFVLVALPWFGWQALRRGKYVEAFGQRLGRLPAGVNADGDDSIWLHAVSVGEVLAARALLPGLREQYPRLRIFLSTTTITGQHVARNNLQYVDAVFYFPFDLPWVVERVLTNLRPRLFLMVESEIWPNLLRACRARGIRTAVVNGRISARSFARYRLVRPMFRRVLAHVDRFCMQGEESARRMVELGADPARVQVTGSLKFDSLDPPATGAAGAPRDRVLRFFRVPESRPVVIAASTLRGEEAAVLAGFRLVRERAPRALLVLAPRHPERFDEVTTLAREDGWLVARRTDLAIDVEPRADIVVLDTIGELARVFQVATIVFVGGSLVDAGGHNVLEPAVFGKPILFGPHMHNFREIAAMFLEKSAAVQVHSARGLAEAMVALVNDPVRRASLGAAARAIVESNRGARERTLAAIAALLPSEQPGASSVRPFRRVR